MKKKLTKLNSSMCGPILDQCQSDSQSGRKLMLPIFRSFLFCSLDVCFGLFFNVNKALFIQEMFTKNSDG